MKKSVTEKIENIVEKKKKCWLPAFFPGNQHFLLFPQWFQSSSTSRSLKPRIAWQRVNPGYAEYVKLTLSQTTSLRLFQIERVCRRQFQN